VLSYVFFLVVIALALLIALREWRMFKSTTVQPDLSYTRRRLRRRLAGLSLLLIVSVMLILYKPLSPVLNTAAKSIAYLGVTLIATLFLFWVVIIDFREMGKTVVRDHEKLVVESLESLGRYFEDQKEKRPKKTIEEKETQES
jgi:hypothetical protein